MTIQTAYEMTVAEIGNLDGYCIEAVANMWKLLRSTTRCVLVRRKLPRSGGGHWTIRIAGVEYDPTFNWWTGGKELYIVGPTSPHNKWRILETSEENQLMCELASAAW